MRCEAQRKKSHWTGASQLFLCRPRHQAQLCCSPSRCCLPPDHQGSPSRPHSPAPPESRLLHNFSRLAAPFWRTRELSGVFAQPASIPAIIKMPAIFKTLLFFISNPPYPDQGASAERPQEDGSPACRPTQPCRSRPHTTAAGTLRKKSTS